jgi:hypothetical protein
VIERPIEIFEAAPKEAVPLEGKVQRRNEHQPHGQGSRRSSMHGYVNNRAALPRTGGKRLEGLLNRPTADL